MCSLSSQETVPAPEVLDNDSGAPVAGPAAGDKGQGTRGRWFADIHRLANKRRRSKTEENYHIYTDGVEFGKAERLADIPIKAGCELYVDVVPVELTDQFIELLRRGVRVFYLRRLTLLKKMYEKLQMKSKTSRNDLRALMAVESRWFKEVSEDFLVMREMISAFRSLERTKHRMYNQLKAASEFTRENLRNVLHAIEMEKTKLARKIVEQAERRIPSFRIVVEELGITGDNHLLAREALAELLTYVDFNLSFTKIRRYLGLYPRHGERYNHDARKALERLTRGLITGTITAKHLVEIAKTIWLTYRRETQKLAGMAQQQG